MKKETPERKLNKNVFYSKMRLDGLTLQMLGKKLTPPITKVRVYQIITTGKPTYRLQEISKILGSNIQTLFPKIDDDKAA